MKTSAVHSGAAVCSRPPSPAMRQAVLGIDAAWSRNHDSGFALVEEVAGCRCRLLAAAPSLIGFATACGLPLGGHSPAGLDGRLALDSAAVRLGVLPHVITADLPLSRAPITGRRAADDAIARHFGAAGCATHSPTAGRPGSVGRELQAALEAAGFRLATAHDAVAAGAIVEVYPHPALLRLMQTARRVPYKVGKTGSYWPGRPYAERVAMVRAQLWRVATHLDKLVTGTLSTIAGLVNRRWTLSGLKPAEDVLDAVISAWVGIVALAGTAEAFGDDASAIWVPAPQQVDGAGCRATPAGAAGARCFS
jgi:predicted RNase H-like nuclease